MTARAARSAALTATVTLGLLAAGAGVASAHVTVSAPGAAAGGSDVAISFRVPDESDSAATTAVTVQLPTDTPIASVLVQPLAGWTSTVTRTKLSTPIKTDDGEITDVVSRIDWKAESAATGVRPGQFGDFVILAGALPDARTLTFKAIQTYSDGTATSWIEVAAPGSTAEPEHPAPVLSLAAAGGAGAGSTTGTAAASPTAAAVVTRSTGSGTALGTIGIVLGAIGIALGGLALAAARRRPASH